MAQEFTIKSQDIEDKINQLLPSQGGFGAGVDFSASTMVIPIVDLTETAEGSSLRQDLQTSLSLTSVTSFSLSGSSSTLVTTTGYYRVYGTATVFAGDSSADFCKFAITDGTTTKDVWRMDTNSSTTSNPQFLQYDFVVLLQAGDSLTAQANSSVTTQLKGITRQIADLSGNLVNP
jgi:hypothetical protein